MLAGEDPKSKIQKIKQNLPTGMECVISWSDGLDQLRSLPCNSVVNHCS